jgi:hypothetical protein
MRKRLTTTPWAEEHYRSAVRASSGYVEAHNNLAILLHERGDLAGAEEHYSTAFNSTTGRSGDKLQLRSLGAATGDLEVADKHSKLSEELARSPRRN